MRRTFRTPMTARSGFTLVELLVAAALCVVIMYVLATAFKAGTDTLSGLKSIGGMADQLRSAQVILNHDLGAQHLEDEDGNKVLVSRMNPGEVWTAPNRGYFKIVQGGWTDEGADGEGISSLRATGNALQFTVKLSGRGPQEGFTANAPAVLVNSHGNLKSLSTSQFASRWAEVSYFLGPVVGQTDTADGSLASLNLQTLYRRQRVIAEGNPMVIVDPIAGGSATLQQINWPDLATRTVSTTPPNETANNETWTVQHIASFSAANRLTALTPLTSTNDKGSDILLANVVSMQVQVMLDGSTTFGDFAGVDASHTATFDTASGTLAHNPVLMTPVQRPKIRAVKLILRVYDTKNKMTRQVSIVQAL